MNPGAVPLGLSSGRLPCGSSACLRLFARIGRPIFAKKDSIWRSAGSYSSTPRPSASQTASFVRSSIVGPRPPVVTMPSARASAARIARAIRSRLSPTACVPSTSIPAARQRLRDERSVRIEQLPEQKLRTDRDDLNAGHRRRVQTTAGRRSAPPPENRARLRSSRRGAAPTLAGRDARRACALAVAPSSR